MVNSAFALQTVIVEPVVNKELQKHERLTGSLKAVLNATLATRESSNIQEVAVNEGDFVQQGDLLLVMDDRRLIAQESRIKAELTGSEALIAQRRADAINKQADVDAFMYSASKNAISERQLRNAKTLLTMAQAGLNEAKQQQASYQAQLQLIKVRLADTKLRAPFNGYITRRLAEPGEWFNQGEPAFSISSSDSIEAWFEVPERLAGTIKLDQTMVIAVNGQKLESDEIKVVANVDPRSRTFNVIATIDNISPSVMAGMSISGWLPSSARAEVMTISNKALVRRNGATLIYKTVQTPQGANAIPVPVSVLFQTGNEVAIAATPALDHGDFIITEGNERLMPGPVEVVTATGKPILLAQAASKDGISPGGK